MNEQLNKYVETTIEILIFSMLVIIVSLFGSLSMDAVRVNGEQQDIQRELKFNRELSTYINKGIYVNGELKDNLISGDDVVRFVGKFRHEIDTDIDLGSKTIKLEKYVENSDGSSDWDIELLTSVMEDHRLSMYKIETIRDEISKEPIKLRFIKQ